MRGEPGRVVSQPGGQGGVMLVQGAWADHCDIYTLNIVITPVTATTDSVFRPILLRKVAMVRETRREALSENI